MLDFPRWKSWLSIFVILISLIVVGLDFYNKYSSTSSQYSSGIKLGLDLRGGSYIVLEANEKVFLQDYVNMLFENTGLSLKDLKIAYTSLQKNDGGITFSLANKDDFAKIRTQILGFDKNLVLENKNGFVSVLITEESIKTQLREVVESSLEIVRRRIDQLGTNEPSIKVQGYKQIVVELPGIDNPEQIKRILGTTARLTFHIVDSAATLGGAPLKPAYKYVKSSDDYISSYAIKIEPEIYGKSLVGANVEFQDNRPVVFFKFDTDGARKFANLTKQQQGNMLAIVLDNKVISAPRINQPISGGSGIITGSFSLIQAQELAILLKAGSLPVPLSIVEERVVGPTLGKQSINAGIIAAVIGYLAVFVFMFWFYKKLGIVANLAIFINAIIILAALSLVGATLTLPGIAGIILTIGMAVDSNILVYERLAFEMNKNKTTSYAMALSNAFKRVFLTITDSNLTTLITALFLFVFGTGPIRGFAITLIIGILASIFGIMFITKTLINIIIVNKNVKKSKRA
jgi:preprotein translocase subunit SecD